MRRLWAVSLLLLLVPLSMLAPSVSGDEAVATEGDVIVTSSDPQGVVLDLMVPGYKLATRQVGDAVYDMFEVRDWGTTLRVGSPQLPVRYVLLAVPNGADVRLDVVEVDSEVLADTYDVVPVPEYVIGAEAPPDELVDSGLVPQPEYRRDEVVYGQDTFYPPLLAEVEEGGTLRGQRMVKVALQPFQYNPVTGKVRVHSRLRVQAVFGGMGPSGTNADRAGEDGGLGGFAELLRLGLLNYGDIGGRADAAPALQAVTPWQPPAPGYKVFVAEDGMYKLAYRDLDAAGLPVGELDPRTFQLYDLGQEIAIEVKGEANGRFEPGEYILFYGQKEVTKYTDEHVYWLTYGAAPGRRMSQRDGEPSGGGEQATSFRRTVRLSGITDYLSAMPGEDDLERWWWDRVMHCGCHC